MRGKEAARRGLARYATSILFGCQFCYIVLTKVSLLSIIVHAV